MRRLVLLLLVAAVATGCTARAAPVDEVAVAVGDVVAREAVPTGRDALAATQGEPHVLWFWGAH